MAFTRQPETVFKGSFYCKETDMEEGNTPSFFTTLNVLPSFQRSSNNIQVQGLLLPVGVTKGVETSAWQGSGQANYDEMKEFFSDVVSHTGTIPTTYTLYHDTFKALNCAVSGWSIQGNVEQIQTQVNFVGRKVTNITAKTIDTIPVPKLYDPMKTTVTINSSPVTKVNAWSIDANGLWNIANYIDETQQSLIQTASEANFSLTLPLESPATTYIYKDTINTCMISNTTPIDGVNYGFSIAFKFYFQAPDSPGDTNGLWTINLKGTIVNDSPKAIAITTSGPSAEPQGDSETQGE